jgi:hypothetical protein
MRIAYLGQMADIANENGISKKIHQQATAWIHAGHTVRYFAAVPVAQPWPGLAPLEADLVVRGRGFARLASSLALCRQIRTWRPDLIYFRYAYHSPGLPPLFRDFPTIAEINSDDLREYGLTLSPAKRWYHRCTRQRVLRRVRGFIPVTHELAERFADFPIPSVVIGNAADFNDLNPLPSASPTERTRVVLIGNTGTPWHGLDRLGELARLLPGMDFVVIGCTAADYTDCDPTRQPPDNLQLLGMLPRQDYLPLLSQATAAFGTLGLYRKQMDEACPLKVREYLTLGLPVIGAYRDTDIPADADYFLRLPNDAESLAPWRDRIAAFIEHWRGRRVPRSAIAHLDVSVKEAQRLAFMDRIVADWHTARSRRNQP